MHTFNGYKRWFQGGLFLAAMACTGVSFALTLTVDRSNYLDGEIPTYTIDGAPPNASIAWSSSLNGVPTLENHSNYGQVTDGSGHWSGVASRGWATADNGLWMKEAFVAADSGQVDFYVSADLASLTPGRATPASQMLGIDNWNGAYPGTFHLSTDPLPVEGANLIQNLNSKTLLIPMGPAINQDFPGMSFTATNLTDLAKTPEFQKIFAMPFTTFVLTAYTYSDQNPYTTPNLAAEQGEISDLVAYLLQTYQGSGKTFIIKNWEGDHELYAYDPANPPRAAEHLWPYTYHANPTTTDHMIAWLNARHQGMLQGRAHAGAVPGVSVHDGVEFVYLYEPLQNLPSMLTTVIPNVQCDYVFYSSYDTINRSLGSTAPLRRLILDDLTYLRHYPGLNGRPLMIGEFGYSWTNFPSDAATRADIATQAFMDSSVPLALYWVNADYANGFGLVTPSNTRTAIWNQFRTLLGAQNNAALGSTTVPSVMVPGATYPVTIQMQNTGNVPWNAVNTYHLASMNPPDNSLWGRSRVDFGAGDSISPGATKTFQFNVTAPTTPGTYTMQWQLTQDIVGHFGPVFSAPVTVQVPEVIDTLDYFLSKNPAQALTGTHPMSQTVVGQEVYDVKWDSTAFEIYRWDANAIYLVEDHSGSPALPYTFTPGIWLKRQMAVGDIISAPTNQMQTFNADCTTGPLRIFPYTTTLEAHIPNLNLGGDLGVQDVIIVRYGYYNSGGQPIYEKSYYSKTWGWVKWELYDTLGNVVQTSLFNKLGGAPLLPGGSCTETNNAAPSNASPISVPTVMTVGQPFSGTVAMKNIGTRTWTQSLGYALGATVTGPSPWTLNSVPLDPSDAIAPSQDKIFTVSGVAPATPGTYVAHWQMVQKNVNGFGTPTSDIQILINAAAQAPLITAQPVNQSVVVGQAATFSVTATGTPPLTYQWYKGLTAIVGATNATYTTPFTVITDNGTPFHVVVNNVTAQPATSITATLTVNPPATVATPTISPAGGTFTGSVSLSLACATVNAQIFYTLDGSAPTTTSALYSGPFSLSGSATIRARAFAAGLTASAEATPAVITINQIPVISQQPSDQTVSVGQTATFAVIATGTQPLTFTWYKNNVAIPGANTASYTTPILSSADSGGQYKVIIDNGTHLPVASTVATLTVNAQATVATPSLTPNGGTFAHAVQFSINCGTPGAEIRYTLDGSQPGSTSPVYSAPLTLTTSTVVKTIGLKVGMNSSAFASAAFVITSTVQQPPVITQQPVAQTVFVGQPAVFSVQATGTDPLTYQWFKDSVSISGATKASYTTPATFLADQGAKYTVVIMASSSPSVTSAAASLTVNPLPKPDLRITGTLSTTANISFDYPYPISSFVWIFTPSDAVLPSTYRSSTPEATAASITTNSPKLDLSLHTLAPGVYTIMLQVYDLNTTLATSASATVTLVQAGFTDTNVYPNPVRGARGDYQVTFASLPSGASVKLFTVSGRWVTTLRESNGKAFWKLNDDSGNPVASGLYLYLINDTEGGKTHGKLTLIR